MKTSRRHGVCHDQSCMAGGRCHYVMKLSWVLMTRLHREKLSWRTWERLIMFYIRIGIYCEVSEWFKWQERALSCWKAHLLPADTDAGIWFYTHHFLLYGLNIWPKLVNSLSSYFQCENILDAGPRCLIGRQIYWILEIIGKGSNLYHCTFNLSSIISSWQQTHWEQIDDLYLYIIKSSITSWRNTHLAIL